MSLVNPHPEPADLEGFAQGTLSEKALAAIESHLVGCPRCRDMVAGVETTISLSCFAVLIIGRNRRL
jgi:anti-sigma factor ChrR (cupin superfamily)